MKILYTTDLHGCEWQYELSLEIAAAQGAQIIVNGGDAFPTDGDLRKQDKFVLGFLRRHFSELESAGIDCVIMPGNDDLAAFDELFEQTCNEFTRVHSVAQRRVEIGPLDFIGMNYVCDYPFSLKDRCRRDDAGFILGDQGGPALLSTANRGFTKIVDWPDHLRSLRTIEEELDPLPKPRDPEHAVYVIHHPPAHLGLDVTHRGLKVGSRAVYRFLEANQPLIALHGHIHESPELSGCWAARLGRTICVQPGQVSWRFSCVLLEIEQGRINELTLLITSEQGKVIRREDGSPRKSHSDLPDMTPDHGAGRGGRP